MGDVPRLLGDMSELPKADGVSQGQQRFLAVVRKHRVQETLMRFSPVK